MARFEAASSIDQLRSAMDREITELDRRAMQILLSRRP
jgi:hypothetical protein